MKILYITTIGSTMEFFTSLLAKMTKEGHSVDIATNDRISSVPECYKSYGCTIYRIDCTRSPFSIGNLIAIAQIRKIVKEGQYDIVHCHTPLAAMCTRFACRKIRKRGTKVIYTAHGFHFFKGAPLKNWLIYYPIEKICSAWTDVLITINQEDYQLAKKKMKASKIEYVPGVGIDLQKYDKTAFSGQERMEKRRELGLKSGECMLLSVGELSVRKNHEVVIQALSKLKDYNWKYYICGKGSLKDYLQDMIDKNGLSERIILLGHRNDVNELCACADLYMFPSLQEGLPVALMEAMASGIPVIASTIRGNTDLVIHQKNGLLFPPRDVKKLTGELEVVFKRQFDTENAVVQGREILNQFELQTVNQIMMQIYEETVNTTTV